MDMTKDVKLWFDSFLYCTQQFHTTGAQATEASITMAYKEKEDTVFLHLSLKRKSNVLYHFVSLGPSGYL